MPEITSRQVARLTGSATGLGKANYTDGLAKKRVVVITSPATATWANGDTIASGLALPIGTRFGCATFISCQDMGTSIVVDIGIRNFNTKVAIDADGIANDIDVATAAVRAVSNNGALVADGVEYTTTEVSEIYATLAGGTPTANAQIRIEVEVITPD